VFSIEGEKEAAGLEAHGVSPIPGQITPSYHVFAYSPTAGWMKRVNRHMKGKQVIMGYDKAPGYLT